MIDCLPQSNLCFFLTQLLVVHVLPCDAMINPSNAKATFVQSATMQRLLLTIKTLSYWYSFESSRWVLSNEYPFARVLVINVGFSHHFVLAKLATSSIRVKTGDGFKSHHPCNGPKLPDYFGDISVSFWNYMKEYLTSLKLYLKGGRTVNGSQYVVNGTFVGMS